MKNKNVTIKEIAKRLGIAVSTVSRALHDAYDVSLETRKRVRSLAEELDYKPNPYAVSLVKHQTNIIGVLLPEIATHYFSTMVKGIQDVAYNAGFNVMFFISNESLEREKLILKNLNINSLDGLLVSVTYETNTSEHFRKLTEKGLPFVFFDRVLNDLQVSRVTHDDFQGAYNVTQHLIQQGYKRIGHLGGPKTLGNAQLRLQGFLEAMKNNNLPVEKKYIIQSGISQDEGIRDVSKILGLKPLPDALFCYSDRKAIGVLLALKRYGYRIPRDIALASFMNAPISEVVEPNLTTVDQAAYEIGAKSCQLLIQHIKTPTTEPQTIMMPSKLIIRDSSIRV
jgi:LacI family transcriptional regulator